MMHTKKEYVFNNESDAQTFADERRVPYDPSADVYVGGPFYRDGVPKYNFQEQEEPCWAVTVEIYK
jgi:hypothetical protein